MLKVHGVIPDTQAKPGIPLDYCRWIGEYLADYQPTHLIHLGDHWDMPSLSIYDKGKKCFEGRRYRKDIDAGNRAMDMMMEPIAKVPAHVWDPEMDFLYGNHDERSMRVGEFQPEFDGIVGYHDMNAEDWGWTCHDYMKPVDIDGVWYCHRFVNPESKLRSGLTGTMDNQLRKMGRSFTMGHVQGLQYGVKFAGGRVIHGLVTGSAYVHDEDYQGYQGNDHWRGMVIKHEVRDGMYDPMFVSMNYLKRTYGKKGRK